MGFYPHLRFLKNKRRLIACMAKKTLIDRSRYAGQLAKAVDDRAELQAAREKLQRLERERQRERGWRGT